MWPPSHPQTGDFPPMSAVGETNQASKQTANHCKRGKRIYGSSAVRPSSARYLVGGETLILQGRRPLGRDAHFHVAERLPRRMQEHIAGGTESKGHTAQKKNAELHNNKVINCSCSSYYDFSFGRSQQLQLRFSENITAQRPGWRQGKKAPPDKKGFLSSNLVSATKLHQSQGHNNK